MFQFTQLRNIPLKALFLLLIISCPNYALAESRCMYDEIMKSSGHTEVVVVPELPQKGNNAIQRYTAVTAEDDEWKPIRIAVSTEDLNDEEKYCTIEAGKNYNDRPDFLGGSTSCNSNTYLTDEKKTTLLNELLPAAIKLHSDRLMVKPIKDKLVVPSLKDTTCKHFTVSESHYTSGVENADKVIYVAVPPTHTWAATCATLHNENGRPIVSAMTFASGDIGKTYSNVRRAAHELAHALGFNHKNMERHNLIQTVDGIRGKPTPVSVVIGEKTKEAVKKHFECENVTGMELEDELQNLFPGTHWERRNAKDELMSSHVGIGLYTSLTMSFFEDLKYYKAQWGMEEPMSWGHKTGCAFLDEKCIQNGRNPFPEMFCTSSKCNQFSCTSDRMAVARCHVENIRERLSDYYKYFVNKNHTGWKYSLTDYCPIVSHDTMNCMNTKYEDKMKTIGSYVGPNSRCLKGDSLTIDGEYIGDVCAEVTCNADKTVKVRYLGDEKEYECKEGGSIAPNETFSNGRIKCPKYEEVCTVADNGESLVTKNETQDEDDDV